MRTVIEHTPTGVQTHTLLGTEAELASVLRRAAGNGQLVSMGAPAHTHDGLVLVTVRLTNLTPTAQPATSGYLANYATKGGPNTGDQRPARQLNDAMTDVSKAATATVIVVGPAIALAVWLMSSLPWSLVLGAAIVLVLLGLMLAPSVARHCPGCRD